MQTWLKCAGVADKTYTTINEVLADSTTLSILIFSNNASDYLVRSTSWASSVTNNQNAMALIGAADYCATILLAGSTWRTAICDSTYFESVLNVKVPTLTSNSSSSLVGTAYASAKDDVAWKAFDGYWERGVVNSAWGISGQRTAKVGFNFTNPVKVCMVKHNQAGTSSSDYQDFKVRGSNDGNTYTDLTNTIRSNEEYTTKTIVLTNNNYYTHYCLDFSGSGWNGLAVYEMNFYGRHQSS